LTSYPELTLDRWAKRFGPLYSMWLGNQLFVVVSDPGIAKDLLVTNGVVFSSRKEMFIKSQTVFAGRGITATPYNDTWFVIAILQRGAFDRLTLFRFRRKHRRIAFTWLNQRAVDSYTDVLDREATELVKSLFTASDCGNRPVNPQVWLFDYQTLDSYITNHVATCWSLFVKQHDNNNLRYPHR
jgi:hypothetical protein